MELELNGAYYSRRLGASNEYVLPTGYMDVGLSKKLSKHWNINLAFTDMFWTSRWDNYSSMNGLQLWNWGKGESRQIKLNISYRFGKEKSVKHDAEFKELDRL